MTTLFGRIISGELPGRFVWRDDRVVAFLSIAPMGPGHTLVVPIDPVDHWIDLPEDVNTHLWSVAKIIGEALGEAYPDHRIGVLIVGEEVPHAHVHLVAFTSTKQMVMANQDDDPEQQVLDEHMELIRSTLRSRGHGDHVPD